MDIEEYQKRVPPKAKRSRLEPYKSQIFQLKNNGYSDLQISDWLAENDLVVTREAVRKFIKTRSQTNHEPGLSLVSGDDSGHKETGSVSPSSQFFGKFTLPKTKKPVF